MPPRRKLLLPKVIHDSNLPQGRRKVLPMLQGVKSVLLCPKLLELCEVWKSVPVRRRLFVQVLIWGMEVFGQSAYLSFDKPMVLEISVLILRGCALVMENDDYSYRAVVHPIDNKAGQEFVDNYNKIRNSPLAKALS